VKAQRSLKARALQLLAQRDQSRVELRIKLLAHARAAARQAEAALAETVVQSTLAVTAGVEAWPPEQGR
jgi:SOS response regulatory protein OraA/RecX